MSDDEKSYIVKPRDPAEIIRFQDSAALSEFLKDPRSVIAGALIEAFSHGTSAFTQPLIRVGVAALTGRALEQFANEIKDFREKGKIPDDWAEKPQGYQTWVELLRTIDDESPDEERLDALKAMFFAVNRVNAVDAERILAYQLFQIAKKLNSNDLLVLKRVNELRLSSSLGGNTYKEWVQLISANSGGLLTGLIDLAENNLAQYRLLSARYVTGTSGVREEDYVNPNNLRLTDLGIRLCENINLYQIDKKSSR